MTKNVTEHAMFSSVQQRVNHKDFQNCPFSCFLSQVEPKKVIQDLSDLSRIEAMQDELLQFKLQKVWTLVDLPYGKRAIGTKWVYKNKKDDIGIMVRNKARLVAQGYTQEEGIDYDEVFPPVARIEAIRLFLAYASFMGFIVYQMDVKSAFLYDTIEEEVYVCQPTGFEDLQFPDNVYKVEKALYGLHQAPRAWYVTLSTYLLANGFRRGTIDKTLFIKKDKGLQVKQKDDGIFISQGKYVDDILKKFDFATVKTTSTPIRTNKALRKDEEAEDVDVHLYRSMIGSLMYLTASRPDIMFAVCSCARFQVTPKVSHLHAIKRIFRYLKGQPKLGLWYPRDSLFELEAFSDSDCAGASLDRKSTTGAQIRFEDTFKQSNDPPLSRVNTLGSGEDSMKLKELMEFCTKLSERALDL
ncbi:putative ribonuclease H-like domain-containing protein [Tanacetum coccineum]